MHGAAINRALGPQSYIAFGGERGTDPGLPPRAPALPSSVDSYNLLAVFENRNIERPYLASQKLIQQSESKMRLLLKFFAVLTILSVCGCGGNSEDFPEIAGTTPEDGSSQALLLGPVQIRFSIDIDPETISPDTFQLRGKEGAQVQGAVSYDESTRTASFEPATGLLKETEYLATLSAAVRDRGGNPLGRDFSWTFSTAGFFFVVLSDVHVRIPGNADNLYYDNAQNINNLEQAVDEINRRFPGADFVMLTGDLVGTLFSADPADYAAGFDTPADRFKAIMDRLSMPYHAALGNHDYSVGFNAGNGDGISASDREIPQVEELWQKLLGRPSYYAFDHEGWRFYVLNSVTGKQRHLRCSADYQERMCTGSFSDVQMDWLEQDLPQREKAFLFFHHPLYTDDKEPADWALPGDLFLVQRDERIYAILESCAAEFLGIFVGHGHRAATGRIGPRIMVHETPALGDMLGYPDNMTLVAASSKNENFLVLSEGIAPR